jgi:dienelactone hydrolase
MTSANQLPTLRSCACSIAALLGCHAADDARENDEVGEAASAASGVGSEPGSGSESANEGTGPGSDGGETGELGDAQQLELAGHSLGGYPWFHVVQDFGDDESVEIAIDPSGLAGRSCDVWVVATRSSAQWQQDPVLIDVRATGPQELAAGDTFADTRVTIAAPAELSSDAGIGLGVGYDVVLDCDRDGAFGAGDVLDGGDVPGLWRTHDTTLPGPLAVTSFDAYASEFLDQRIFHPSAIAEQDLLPLVVVTHGWSYTHTYYDYIGEHLASYGYIVMFHEADVQDGGPEATLSAATTTLDNLEDLLANQDAIGDGVLSGHIDAGRIMLIGHSTGGEAVVRAVTELREGTFTSQNFGIDDIRVVSSMAPVSWHPRGIIDPGELAYHMFVAGADDDVSGAPEPSYTQCRSIFERATGERQLTYIHGAGHGDLLSCCGEPFRDESAPDLIGREETNRVARGYLLPLAELYLRDNPAAREYFTRPFADFHPQGIAANVVVTNEHRTARAGAVVLDDFQGNEALELSSSGAAVSFDVAHPAEVLMKDNDGSLAWTGDQPSNGMTEARHPGDDPRAVVFDWSPGADHFYELAVPESLQDFTAHAELSLRVAQGTRHPETVALAGPLSFTLTLRDQAGVSSSIALAELAAVPPPYARDGFGAGVGWQNEFTTIRVRIAELAVDSAIDLSRIEAVRLEFGASFGSPRGRIGLDDIELVH